MMFLYRIISVSAIITLMSVGYVHQKVEIIKEGYSLQERKLELARLVDHNSKLMYNLSKLESPRSMLTILDTGKIEFANHRMQLDRDYRLIAAVSEKESMAGSLIGRFLDLFSVRAEAKPRS